MPRGDRTGPYGMGPMTGRGMGFCAGFSAPGFAKPAPGGSGGPWFGRRGGRGWCHWYYATGVPGWARAGYYPAWGAGAFPWAPTAEQETEFLQNQAGQLRAWLERVEGRLRDLEASAGKQPEEGASE